MRRMSQETDVSPRGSNVAKSGYPVWEFNAAPKNLWICWVLAERESEETRKILKRI